MVGERAGLRAHVSHVELLTLGPTVALVLAELLNVVPVFTPALAVTVVTVVQYPMTRTTNAPAAWPKKVGSNSSC